MKAKQKHPKKPGNKNALETIISVMKAMLLITPGRVTDAPAGTQLTPVTRLKRMELCNCCGRKVSGSQIHAAEHGPLTGLFTLYVTKLRVAKHFHVHSTQMPAAGEQDFSCYVTLPGGKRMKFTPAYAAVQARLPTYHHILCAQCLGVPEGMLERLNKHKSATRLKATGPIAFGLNDVYSLLTHNSAAIAEHRRLAQRNAERMITRAFTDGTFATGMTVDGLTELNEQELADLEQQIEDTEQLADLARAICTWHEVHGLLPVLDDRQQHMPTEELEDDYYGDYDQEDDQ